MPKPHIEATVVRSDLLYGYLSLRAIKDGKPTRFEFVLEDHGFVPGDIVRLVLNEEYEQLKEHSERYWKEPFTP